MFPRVTVGHFIWKESSTSEKSLSCILVLQSLSSRLVSVGMPSDRSNNRSYWTMYLIVARFEMFGDFSRSLFMWLKFL